MFGIQMTELKNLNVIYTKYISGIVDCFLKRLFQRIWQCFFICLVYRPLIAVFTVLIVFVFSLSSLFQHVLCWLAKVVFLGLFWCVFRWLSKSVLLKLIVRPEFIILWIHYLLSHKSHAVRITRINQFIL